MEQTVQELCWLIQEVLFDNKHEFTISDSERLFHIARENGLSGTVFEVVKNHGVSDEIYKKIKKEFYKYVAQDEEQLRYIKLLKNLFEESNINYRFLKGSVLKSMYPKTYMRAMGDIDVLVSDEDRNKMPELFKKIAVNLESRGYVHDYYVSETGMSIEVHSRLIKKKEEYIDLNSIDDIIKQKKNSCELEIVYLLYHLKKHLLAGGIGLRSVIDVGVYINHSVENIDLTTLDSMLDRNGLSKLFENIILFNDVYLDTLMKDKLNIKRDVNSALLESFTAYIVVSGIHGLGMSFNSFNGTLTIGKKKRFRRFRLLLEITFLPYDTLRYMYPNYSAVDFLCRLHG